MDAIFEHFAQAYNGQKGYGPDGYDLANTIRPQAPTDDPARFYNFLRSSNTYSIQTDLRYKLQYNPDLKLDKKEASAWIEVFTSFYKFVSVLLTAEEAQNAGRAKEADWSGVYEGWRDVVNSLYKGYQSNVFAAWTVPCLYVAGKYLRVFAIKADDKTASQRDSRLASRAIQEEDAFSPDSKHEKLEDAARQINRIFGLCISDRESRKWALYYTANLLFKTYFKLGSISLSKNILRSLRASTADMPPLSAYPNAHRVTFKYYCGVIHFLEEDYATAEEYLTEAYDECRIDMPGDGGARKKNMELILMYLIPTRLLTAHKLPTHQLLAPYPRLASLFNPISTSIRSANLSAFNAAMEAGEDEFVKRRIYLTLERGRDIILRNIFRKVFIAGGFEEAKEGGGPATRRTRVPVREFAAALQMAGAEVGDGDGGVDGDEVECLIANAIYKKLMKGYIARERGIVVLSKAGAFPGTGI
ncbi:COP9 signalosome (CSN) subunit [Vermiconidia calcicola]|uniref:COP9 signalosome (CSN) subunit n=1 Tax=Vermiconidia calcicola TaxID=1690605 RepID=A0ACC3NVH6_9PEZI|nr:COP9 signalosome (CSN) subunit [Vermiconidia calcicola]